MISYSPNQNEAKISDQHQRPLVALFKKYWQVCLSGDRFELLFTTSPPGIWCHQVFGATRLLVAFDGNLNFSLIHTQVMSTLKPDSNDHLPN